MNFNKKKIMIFFKTNYKKKEVGIKNNKNRINFAVRELKGFFKKIKKLHSHRLSWPKKNK
jgi:hypothetical protein